MSAPTVDLPTFADIPAALDRLVADHPDVDDLAEHFRALGIRGIPGDPTMCVIAEYLHRAVPGSGEWTEGVDVQPSAGAGCAYVTWGDGWRDLPPVLNELAMEFDDRQCPDLIFE